MYEENEVEQEIESTSDESTESSSETPSKESSETETAEAGSETKTDADNVPFHEHPRFKELVEQKNEYATKAKALEEKYAAMEAQLKQLSNPAKPPTEQEKDDLIEDLKKIDPRLAARLEKFGSSAKALEDLQKKLESFEQNQAQSTQQALVKEAVAQVNTLHEQNKVSPELKSFINNEIDRRYAMGQLKRLDQVQSTYKEIYDQYNKFIDGIKRAERESYVKDKKKDSGVPTSQPKGQAVSHTPKKMNFSKDPEVARQQIVSRYLKTAKAESEL